MTAKTNGHLQIILITVRRSHPPGDDHTHNTDKNRISQYSENYRVAQLIWKISKSFLKWYHIRGLWILLILKLCALLYFYDLIISCAHWSINAADKKINGLLEEQPEDSKFNLKQILRHIHFAQGLFIATQCGLIFSIFPRNFSICYWCHNPKWVLNPFTLLPVW